MMTRRTALASLTMGALAALGGEAVAKRQMTHLRGVIRYAGDGVLPIGAIVVKLGDFGPDGKGGAGFTIASMPVGSGGRREVEFNASVASSEISRMRDPMLYAEFKGKGPYAGRSKGAAPDANRVIDLEIPQLTPHLAKP